LLNAKEAFIGVEVNIMGGQSNKESGQLPSLVVEPPLAGSFKAVGEIATLN
jgi:hypothetical protein